MGTAGIALRWENRIACVPSEGGRRVEPSEVAAGERTGDSATADDAGIAAGCLAGDLRAYERLYRWQGARMKNLARNLLGSQTDAEDAVQDTFLKIQRGIRSYRGQSSFVTWAFRVLVNTCYDVRRSRMRRKEQSHDESQENVPRPERHSPASHPTLKMALERALAKLTEHQRDVFLLYEVEGFRHAEIAELLAISETASKNTLFQAKKNLRVMLEPPRSAEAGGL